MARGVKGRVVVVTGAASGIGAATSELLADAGAHVARLDMKWPTKTPQDSTGRFVRVLDVANEAAVEQSFQEIVGHFGSIDGLATCAGITNTDDFNALDAATFRRVYEVNVIGTFLCIKAAAAKMRQGISPRRKGDRRLSLFFGPGGSEVGTKNQCSNPIGSASARARGLPGSSFRRTLPICFRKPVSVRRDRPPEKFRISFHSLRWWAVVGSNH